MRHLMLLSAGAFQSSPGPKTGCTPRAHQLCAGTVFQSSPGPKTGCNRAARVASSCREFQSSPGPKTGCNRGAIAGAVMVDVSILTRPEDRVQKTRAPRDWRFVSILTRPVDRVLPEHYRSSPPQMFQSSPGPKTGCTRRLRGFTDASNVSILTRPEDRVLNRALPQIPA